MLADKMRMKMEQLTAADDVRPLLDTLLVVSGDRAKIDGRFEVDDSLEVECEIAGELDINGTLTIGEHGVVRAAVKTVDAIIRGRYEGELFASGEVEIAETGWVNGNIHTDSLVIAKGGSFNGKVIHSEDERGKRQEVAGEAGAKIDLPQPGQGATTVEPVRPPVAPPSNEQKSQRNAA